MHIVQVRPPHPPVAACPVPNALFARLAYEKEREQKVYLKQCGRPNAPCVPQRTLYYCLAEREQPYESHMAFQAFATHNCLDHGSRASLILSQPGMSLCQLELGTLVANWWSIISWVKTCRQQTPAAGSRPRLHVCSPFHAITSPIAEQ